MAKAKKKKQKTFLNKIFERLAGAAFVALVLSVWFSVGFYHPQDTAVNIVNSQPIHNLLGLFGAITADYALSSYGLALPVFLIAPLIWGGCLLRGREFINAYSRITAWVLGVNFFAIVLALQPWHPGIFSAGGTIGVFLSRRLISFMNTIYTYGYTAAIAGAIFGILVFMAFNYSVGITYKNWWAAFKAAALTIWKVLKGFKAAANAIFGFRHRQHVSERPARKPRKEPKAKVRKERVEPGFGSEERQIKTAEEPEVKAKTIKQAPKPVIAPQDGYVCPNISLLSRPKDKGGNSFSKEELDKTARELEGVLQEFGVNGRIVKVRPGPVVTLYELEPAPGTKSARVIGLADDIARSMSVISVRIAVVPGCNTIGIELPNRNRETVWLRDLFEDPDFLNSKNELNVVLGKDIGGKDVYADLTKMPHLLVAGTTGSGKSVGVNSMILSLLFKMRPEECKLIMIDPKMLEFSMYNGIPHLLTPVITDPAKAVIGLKWAVKEMEDRYRAMAQLNVRNIAGYNQKLAEIKASGKNVKRTVQTGFDSETGKPIYEEQELDLTPLPYIVIVVDEMADLMLVAGKDVEAAIQRLAQMARAAGLHLIMSTQRPSVDVITGTIKANFPTRISFQVTSKIDSRTILGEQGAEQLLGKGDMLYMPAGQRPIRIHGAFVKDSEVEGIVEFIKSQKAPEYVEAVTEGELNDKDSGSVFDKGDFGSGSDADLYAQAVAIVQQDKKASTSYIQRKLRIGYNRAASLIDRMEQEGIISAADHVGRREVL